MAGTPTAPKLNDPVVINGRKHRITKIEGPWAVAKPAMSQKASTNPWPSIPVDRLEWDKVAGLWRVRA